MMEAKVRRKILAILMSLALVFTMMPMMSQTVYAEPGWDEGFNLEIDQDEGTAVICGRVEGNEESEITIPNEVTFNGTTYNVSKIGEVAFARDSIITSLKVADGITEIGNQAFFSCRNLQSVIIPQSLKRIGEYAFGACSELTSIDIPPSVEVIGKRAFRGTQITSVVLPGGIAVIDEGAFSNCGSLKEVTIPSTVTEIGSEAFANCGSLKLYYEGSEDQWDEMSGRAEDWSKNTDVDMVFKVMKIPTKISLNYNGEMQTGVEQKEGYTLEGHTAVNAGSYTATATPDEGYSWIDDTTEAKNIPWSIGKSTVVIKPKDQTYPYTGELEGPDGKTYSGEDDIAEYIEVQGMAPTDTLESVVVDGQGKEPGEHPLTASEACILNNDRLEANDNYNIVHETGTLFIVKRVLNITVNGSSSEKEYNGEVQSYTGEVTASCEDPDFIQEYFHYSGGLTVQGTDADVYSLVLDPAKCEYDSDLYDVNWTIGDPVKLTISKSTIEVPLPASKTYTYDGKGKSFIMDGAKYTLSGTTKATNAGTYTAKATLNMDDNYIYTWSDGTTAAKKIKWTIKKANNPLTIKARTATVKGCTKGKKGKLKKSKKLAVGKVINVVKQGQGKMTYTKSSGNKKITIAKTTGKVTVKKGLKKGTYKVKVKVKAAGNTNYKASAVKIVTFKVTVK